MTTLVQIRAVLSLRRDSRRAGPHPRPLDSAAWLGALGCLPGEDGSVESLSELRERRGFQCRLTPDRVLGSVDEAEVFLRDRGLLTRTADCALPSLYEACHEDPYKIGGAGFAA